MKYFKIVNNINSYNKSIDLTILSYNICWEAITSFNNDKYSICNNNYCKYNILSNIKINVEKYFPDFITFQEASEENDIIQLFNLNLYDYFINKSGNEIMLTLWNKQKFKLINSYYSEFEIGRPFAIFIFFDIYNNKNISLINLHAGHLVNTQETIFNIINDFIKLNINSILKKSISRLIMSGDFNRDIYKDDTSDYIVKFSKKFKLFRFLSKKKTCCDINGINFENIYDHIIDSNNKIIKKILPVLHKNYKLPSSDHIMIIAKFEN